MARATTYAPITDWSREGRRRFLAEHRSDAELLLDQALNQVWEDGFDLRACGFKGDDPVSEAVAWSLDRFCEADLDSRRIQSESRSLRLFTEAWFWLAQRVGTRALRRIRNTTRRSRRDVDPSRLPAPEADDAPTGDDDVRRERIAMTLRELSRRCCPALVTWWLEGAVKFRAALFDDADPLAVDRVLTEAPVPTPKQRSLRIADALFRYLALYLGFIDPEGGDLSHRACVRSWFSTCDNRPPYERAKELVMRDLGDLPSRQMTTLRQDGAEALIGRCVEVTARPAEEDESGDGAFARWSLRKTLLERYDVENASIRRDFAAIKEQVR